MLTADTPATRVHRIEVHPQPHAGDPIADRVTREAAALGIKFAAAHSARIYLIEAAIDSDTLARITEGLLADPVTETAVTGATDHAEAALIEVHPLPGVMDPAAASLKNALRDLYNITADVSTGARYTFDGLAQAQADTIAARLLMNPVVQAAHTEPHHPSELPKGHAHDSPITHIPIRGLGDADLEKLSRDAHLFLDLNEMRAIRDEYETLGREPTAIELETLAQTWSEHCVHKTLKSTITYRNTTDDESQRAPGASQGIPSTCPDPINWSNRPGHTLNPDGSVTIHNLLKSTVAAATFELIDEGLDWTLSVFVDNAGVIAFDDDHAINIKDETHNHPSALEPYGGAATGIGGCIRDVIATGLAAKPIANTDVFCVATPAIANVPAGCIHPTRVLDQVVAGVRDYGNRMGIPTLNGAVWFDDRYIGNPLVYCGCVGLMKRQHEDGEPDSLITGAAKPGDRIIALGGRTGRDGIHGATFSSAELTDTHADEFSHAVQIGNAIEEKRALDAILRARDYTPVESAGDAAQAAVPLFNAITDCGAGGFSSAVGEMGEQLGADVHLDRAPLKYPGLTHTEIWISEAQERFVLAVPEANLPALKAICDEEHVEIADLGHFGTENRVLILNHAGREVGRLPMALLHDGIPMPTREAEWSPASPQPRGTGFQPVTTLSSSPSVREALLTLLAHPNIASKHKIIRQYDHEVQGNTVVRPLGGPLQRGPMDAAVIQPVPGTNRGLAIASGLATNFGDPDAGGDPYLMALAAIDEVVRNLVCVGADPDRIAILDNFCWPSCKKPQNLASLVRAAEGCYDAAKAYRTPFVSGKDSLNNQFTIPGENGEAARTIEIPPTLLITGIGIVPDITKCVTMDAKRAGNNLVIIENRPNAHIDRLDNTKRVGGSHLAAQFGVPKNADPRTPRPDPVSGAKTARVIAEIIRRGYAVSAHDASEGGPLVAVAEMLIAGSSPDSPLGAAITLTGEHPLARNLGDHPHTYILEVPWDKVDDIANICEETGDALHTVIGEITDDGALEFGENGTWQTIPVEDLAKAWLTGLGD